MNKKRVLFILQLPPPVHGVSVMNEIIFKSQLVNGHFTCDYINLATASSVNDLQKNGLRKYFLTLSIIFKTAFNLSRNRYTAVYITIFPYGFAFVKDSIIVLIAKLFGHRPFLHLHTFGFREHAGSGGIKNRYYRKVFRNTQPICLSSRLLADIETIYKGEVSILPNGIHPSNFENTYTGAQQPPVILYLSNLIRGKGVLLLVEAARILRDRKYDFKLRIAGPEGNVTYDELGEAVRQRGISELVTLLGPRFGDEKVAELKNATVFALPSDYDTFGLVLLEAMQFGVPCVSTGINGIPDVLGDGRGVIMAEISPIALADALAFLLDNPEERKRISMRGFSYFHDNFTVRVFEENLIKILEGRAAKTDRRLA